MAAGRILALAFAALLALAMAACAAPRSGDTDGTVAAPPMSDPLPATPLPAPTRPGTASGVPALDASCRVDSDCAVKNVGNCCGYYPACVNKDAKPNPEAVQAACAASGLAGVCGFREIQACACVAARCEPAPSAAPRSGLSLPEE